MILCDTGVIVAALDPNDDDHKLCTDSLKKIRTSLTTTWPCITEAMYLLGVRAGYQGQEKLRQQIERGVFDLIVFTIEDANRACALMRRYSDTPIDFADASLVAAAESLNVTRILTLDSHFYAYRINGNTPFEVIP
jgi:predicted nucleic acid-binding protein